MRRSDLVTLFPWLLLAGASCDSGRPGGPAGQSGGAGGAAIATGGASATGSGGQGGQSSVVDDVPTIMAAYQTWEPRTTAPVDISAMIFALCRGPTNAEMKFVQSAHTRFALRDWFNPAAVAGLAARGVGGYAVGAAIVKEKFAAPTPGAALELAALGMMIKRAPGFDAAGGDWEFVYWNATDGVARGSAQLPACTTCHATATATDFVYANTDWQQPTAP